MDVTTNGHAEAVSPAQGDLWLSAEYEAALDEIRAQGATMETRLWQSKILIGGLGIIVLLLSVLGVILGLKAQAVVPFVQVVQVESGRVQMLGVPIEMMEYTPQDGQWLGMLWEYIMHLRWQSEDPVQMTEIWKPQGWLDLYTCGPARQLLKAEYDEQKTTKAKKVKVSLEASNITKIDVPMAFNVQWDEWRVEGSSGGTKSKKSWVFLVGRRPVNSVQMRMINPFGLCVTNFNKGPLR